MKTKIYSHLIILTLAGLVITNSAFSQRYRHDRGYYGHSWGRSYAYSRPYVSVHVGGYGYYRPYPYYYRPYGSYFQLSVPPFGFRIGTLPYGYRSFYFGPDPYYYYNGIYYRPYADQYEVVAPPLGAVVDELPRGAKVKVIDGQKYYEFNGTYYQEEMDEHNRLSYKVMGTDGVLNTEPGSSDNVQSGPQIGDRVDQLPGDSKPVVINGEKLYSTPDGLYYKEVLEGSKVYYELVGK